MNLTNKHHHSQTKIAIIGLGNVGLNLLLNSAKHFHQIIGVDIDKNRIELLKNGQSYLSYVSDLEIKSIQNCIFTTDYSQIKSADIICLCLPTSSHEGQSQTLIFQQAFNQCLNYLKENVLIISESTLPVGFHDEFIIPTLKKHFSLGKNLFLGYAPERINPGKKSEYRQANARVFTGFCEISKQLTRNFYQSFIPNLHEISNFKTAEFTKIFENAYRALNIAFIDEIKNVSDKLDLNIYEIIQGAQSKGMSFEAHFPSAGVGGACIPMSLDYLEEAAKKAHIKTEIAHQAKMQNQIKINQIINQTKAYKNVLILGASYKKNLADLTCSSTLKVIEGLQKFNIKVTLCDPLFKQEAFTKLNIKFDHEFDKLDISQYEAVLLMVEHHEFNLLKIKQDARNLIDPKGLCLSLKI